MDTTTTKRICDFLTEFSALLDKYDATIDRSYSNQMEILIEFWKEDDDNPFVLSMVTKYMPVQSSLIDKINFT